MASARNPKPTIQYKYPIGPQPYPKATIQYDKPIGPQRLGGGSSADGGTSPESAPGTPTAQQPTPEIPQSPGVQVALERVRQGKALTPAQETALRAYDIRKFARGEGTTLSKLNPVQEMQFLQRYKASKEREQQQISEQSKSALINQQARDSKVSGIVTRYIPLTPQ